MTQKKIALHPYNPQWPKTVEHDSAEIEKILGSHCLVLHHIGSTSIPGLTAKEDLDIMCVVDDLKSSLALRDHGFIFKGELNIPLRYFFSKNTEKSKVNLHVVEPDHGFINWILTFRDYLRAHDEARDAYAALKTEIVKDAYSGERVQNMLSKYTYSKSDFIDDILRKAGFDGLSFYFCFHKSEWEAYQRILGKEAREVEFKRLSEAFNNENHFHFILKKGADVVAVAFVELVGNQGQILELAEDRANKGKGYNHFLRAIIEKWIRLRSA